MTNTLKRRSRQVVPLLMLLAFLPHNARGQELTAATFTSTTGNDDKDHDTAVFVRVVTADGKTVLAQISNGDNCDRCRYADGTTHTLALPIGTRAAKGLCANFKFVLGARANGHDRWVIDTAMVTLKFSDGSTLQRNVRYITLDSRGSSLVAAEY
jgi:hypothetical protein